MKYLIVALLSFSSLYGTEIMHEDRMGTDAKTIVKHEWLQLLVLSVTVGGLFLWTRTESRNDYRELRSFTESNLNTIRQDAKDFREMWAQETKEFHGKLERQDAEFKSALLLIEEKIKNRG